MHDAAEKALGKPDMSSSMTGFGRGESVSENRRITVEIKSINNRYCDVQIRMPRVLASLENRVREQVGKRISRGKVDLTIGYDDSSAESTRVVCNVGLAKAYAEALRDLAKTAGVPDGLSARVLAQFSDVMHVEPAVVDPEKIWDLLAAALDIALTELCRMRALEGSRLVDDLFQHADIIEDCRLKVTVRAPMVITEYRQRLMDRIQELLGEQTAELFDDQRLAGEVALYADKCAIDEELVRLHSHLAQLKTTAALAEPVGKKLDFLIQEINREINTIGSKANDLDLVNLVVTMKSELEKIREQIQNLE